MDFGYFCLIKSIKMENTNLQTAQIRYKHKVSVVILNWNGEGFLKKYLPALVENTPQYAEIVVADNGSTDNSVEWIRQNYTAEQVRLILFDKNYGFTGGYNRAFKETDCEYFMLLNSDIRIEKGWLEPMVEFMDSHPNVGIVQPKVLAEYRPEYFEYAGAAGGLLDVWGFPYCYGRLMNKVEKDNGQYNASRPIFWATGAAMCVRSEIYDKLGGLDEQFFAHMEEIDFCWRTQIAGYEVWSVPQAVVYHVGGGTLPQTSPFKLYLNYRNNLLMLYKNYPHSTRGLLLFWRKCLDGLCACVYILQGKGSYVKSVWKAHKDFAKMKRVYSKDTRLEPAKKAIKKRLRGSVFLKKLFS